MGRHANIPLTTKLQVIHNYWTLVIQSTWVYIEQTSFNSASILKSTEAEWYIPPKKTDYTCQNGLSPNYTDKDLVTIRHKNRKIDKQ